MGLVEQHIPALAEGHLPVFLLLDPLQLKLAAARHLLLLHRTPACRSLLPTLPRERREARRVRETESVRVGLAGELINFPVSRLDRAVADLAGLTWSESHSHEGFIAHAFVEQARSRRLSLSLCVCV